MFYSQDEFAYVVEGDVSLLTFPNAYKDGPMASLLWSASNPVVLLYGCDIDSILSISIDVFTENGESETLELQEMLPSAKSMQECEITSASGWFTSSEKRFFYRVSPQVHMTEELSYEYYFIIYDASDDSIVHWPFSNLLKEYPISNEELKRMLDEARVDFEPMCMKINEINDSL